MDDVTNAEEHLGLTDVSINVDDRSPNPSPRNVRENANDFLIKPVPRGTILKCHVKLTKSGMFGVVHKWEMFFEKSINLDAPVDTDGNAQKGSFILGARKLLKMFKTKYIVSSRQAAVSTIKEGADFCLGVLTGNFSGQKFMLKGGNDSATTSHLRDTTAMFFFKDFQPPRTFTVMLPRVEDGDDRVRGMEDAVVATANADSAAAMVYSEVTVCMPKWPRWDEDDRRFTQNYFGRCSHASSRNFQLAEVTKENPCEERPNMYQASQLPPVRREELALLSGALAEDEDTFSLDVHHPFSPVQAFAAFLASATYKIMST